MQANLFSRGFMTRQPSLSDVLDGHKRGVLHKIKSISTLEEMTDSYLANLVKQSVVEPIVLHTDRMTRSLRTEEIDGSRFPGDFNVLPGRLYPKTVARISIPFSGDHQLFEFTPNTCGSCFPVGQVSGGAVHFDVILWGYNDDEARVKGDIQRNLELLQGYTKNVFDQVKTFNESLPPAVKATFQAKLDELTKQHSIFESLGIKGEDPVTVAAVTGGASASTAKPKTGKARAVQIIQIIENQYVQQLNQTNNNIGDVNNAIQSSE